MKKPSRILAPAILLTLMPFMFQFDGNTMSWTWAQYPLLAAAMLAGGALCWMLYLRARVRSRGARR